MIEIKSKSKEMDLPRCPSADDWTMKYGTYVYITEFLSTIKKIEICRQKDGTRKCYE